MVRVRLRGNEASSSSDGEDLADEDGEDEVAIKFAWI